MYNTRARKLKGQNIMANHVMKITLPQKIPTPASSHVKISQTVEDWEIRDTKTGEVTTQPCKINEVILPDTGKVQEYKHKIKGHDMLKWTRSMSNKIDRFFQEISDIEGTDPFFHPPQRYTPRQQGNIL